MPEQLTNYQCPNCNGPLKFDPVSSKLKCDSCGSTFTVDEIDKVFFEKNQEAISVDAEKKQQENAELLQWNEEEAKNMRAYNCPSCGAQLNLKGNETNCPYCGAFIQSQFYDWQTEDFRIYHLPDPNARNLLYTGGLILALFLPAVPCIRFITNMYLAFGLAFVLTILVAFGMLSFITPKLEKEEKLKEQIVRYDESWLASNINEALYKSVLTPELLTYIVDDIKIKSVENTEDTTTISVSAKLRRTILENDQHIVAKNEKENWTLSRALHPNRLKSKGQDIVIEKECPSCGANYVPDEKGCCSYCGYSLKVDNSKWKINASEKRNMSTIV